MPLELLLRQAKFREDQAAAEAAAAAANAAAAAGCDSLTNKKYLDLACLFTMLCVSRGVICVFIR